MSDSPTTRHSLLLEIRDLQNHSAWATFVHAYAPLVFRYARSKGLQDADAADITQDTLRSVAQAAGEFVYDPARGKFRTWLYTVARNKVINHADKRSRQQTAVGDTADWEQVQNVVDPASADEAEWDRDYERNMFQWACDRVRGDFREATWQAFWQTAVEGKSAGEVATALSLSPGAVYVAKSRVLAAMKEEIARLVGEQE